MHTVKLEEQPEELPCQYSDYQNTPHSSIRLQAISFPGTSLETTVIPNITVPASTSTSGHQNTVQATLVQHLTNFDTNDIHKWASSGSVHVVLDWRLDEKPHPVFKTRHLLTTTSDDTHPDSSSVVVFAGSLDWAHNLAEHVHAVTRARELASAAHPTQPQPRSRLAACCGNSSRGCSHCVRRRARSVRLVLEEQIAVEPEGGDRCGGGSIQDTKKRQCSQKLVERHRSYAEEIFRASGDTSELLQATSLSRRMLGSQPPTQQQQQPRRLLIRGGRINKPGCWSPPHRMWRSSP
ncbi:hypothetical protein B0T19DRAFT_397829 [Cercophora scortea]|uniref:Uncharacterized protein n=1 Tax=Cercophora scortea TaxID=314031 RepID=A0AAE0IVE0_9PEZI|nr:hypothetical protein B0T19DRAFT_397829 [Cercophora scortea]